LSVTSTVKESKMHRKISIVLGMVLLAVFGAWAPAMATQDPFPSGYYQLIRSYDWPDVCLEVDRARTWDGADVTVDWCAQGGMHQQWTLVPVANGYYYQIVVQHTGKCLDVRGVSHSDGAQIQQYKCLGAGQWNQHWRLVETWHGDQFVARHSGKCLDRSGWNVVQWSCHDGYWQQWELG
jgi:hypothetical protein